jgi:hypothetical protein
MKGKGGKIEWNRPKERKGRRGGERQWKERYRQGGVKKEGNRRRNKESKELQSKKEGWK